MKKFSIIGISLLGKVRKRNEDSFVFTDDLSKRNQLAVITDGIGGCGHGDTASRFICELFYQEFEKQKAADLKSVSEVENFLLQAVETVNAELYELNTRTPEYQKCFIGTTLVAAVIMEKNIVFVHVGDSRLYELNSQKELILHTEDHTLLAQYKKYGEEKIPEIPNISVAEYGHILTKAVGVKEKISSLPKQIQTIKRNSKSRYLICSDGLNHQISDGTIEKILAEAPSNEAALNKLVLATYIAGAEDNLTIILWQ